MCVCVCACVCVCVRVGVHLLTVVAWGAAYDCVVFACRVADFRRIGSSDGVVLQVADEQPTVAEPRHEICQTCFVLQRSQGMCLISRLKVGSFDKVPFCGSRSYGKG